MGELINSLSKEYLQKLDNISYGFRERLHIGQTGGRKALGYGNSLEFSDFRPYTLGDDVRRMDWNSFARFQKLFVKLYAEEKQATASIFLDTSLSMGVLPEKALFAKLLVASLSYIFLKNADRVNVYFCGEQLALEPQKLLAANQFLSFAKKLDELLFKNATNLSASLAKTAALHFASGPCFVISDFFSQDGFESGIKILQNKQQHIVLLHVLDKEEVTPSFLGRLRLIDVETNEHINIDMTEETKMQYEKALADHKHNLENFCQKRNMGYLFTDTSTHVLEFISTIVFRLTV